MRMLSWLMALMLMVCGSSVAFAQDGEKPKGDAEKVKEEAKEEAKEEGEETELARLQKIFKGADEIIKPVVLKQEDIDLYKKHSDSFDEAMAEDEKFEELKDKSIKEAYEHAIKSEKYLAWAKSKELNAEDYLRKSIRITILEFKLQMEDGADEQIEELESMLAMIEGMKENMDEEQYNETVKSLKDAIELYKGMVKVAAGFKFASEEEEKLMKAYVGE